MFISDEKLKKRVLNELNPDKLANILSRKEPVFKIKLIYLFLNVNMNMKE